MTRSLWKGPFVDHFLLDPQSSEASTVLNKKKIWSRPTCILPQIIGQHVAIHNGKTFISLSVTEEMVGHKFGEFAMTRKRTVHKKKDKRKK
jgi:small subunit ribosomal protein S19